MKTLQPLAIMLCLWIALTSCTSMPKPTESPKLTETPAITQTIQPTQVAVPTDLAFSMPLVQALNQSGLTIVSVQSSAYMAMFSSTNKAVWIKSNEGAVEAVFFAESVEVEHIHVTEQPNEVTGRYLYTIQAPPPTLVHDQTIDAAYPLYFTAKNDMLMITSSEELDKALKHIFLGQ